MVKEKEERESFTGVLSVWGFGDSYFLSEDEEIEEGSKMKFSGKGGLFLDIKGKDRDKWWIWLSIRVWVKKLVFY